MSRFWQARLQETVGKTVTGFSESAARLKQGWVEAPSPIPPSPGGSSGSGDKLSDKQLHQPAQQQYLRLPVESARKLRWYDREDLKPLVEATLKDKQLLQETIAALRQALHDGGIQEPSLPDETQTRLEDAERLAYHDGVNAVLLAGCLTEVDALREQLAAASRQLHVASYTPSAHENGIVVPHEPITEPVHLHIHIRAAPSASVVSQLQAQAKQPLPDSPVLRHPSAAAEQLEEAAEQPEEAANGALADGGVVDLEEAVRQLEEERKGSAALLAKLTRVERERREHVDELAEVGGRLEAARSQAAQLQHELAAAEKRHAEAATSSEHRLQELRGKVAASQSSSTDLLHKAQDICAEAEERASVADRRADKGEARAARAEGDAKEARAEAKRLGADLKARQKEAELAGSRAKAAEAALQEALLKRSNETEKGDALSSTLALVRKAAEEREAELRRQLREAEQQLHTRISGLEAEAAEYKRAATAALAELENLDHRAALAETALEAASADMHALEGAAAEKDAVEAQCVALRERLDETRAQADQLANYKQIAAKLEEEKARVEAEVLATARIATGLEARLRSAQAAQEASSAQAAAALQHASEAEKRVEREVARRLEAASSDEASWPAAAREEVTRLSQRLEASKRIADSLQADLEAEVAAHEREAISRASLQMRLTSAEERAARLEREVRDCSTRLERQLSAARAEAEDWRREASEDRRSTRERWSTLRRSSASSLGQPHTPTRGGGSLLGDAGDLETEGDRSWSGRHGSRQATASATGGPEREQIGGVDIVYLKNVVLKFLDAQANGRADQIAALLPAVAALLRASPQEFHALSKAFAEGRPSSWWHR